MTPMSDRSKRGTHTHTPRPYTRARICMAVGRARCSWRRFKERPAIKAISTAAAIDEAAVRQKIAKCLKHHDQLMTQYRKKMGDAAGAKQATSEFQQEMFRICNTITHERDSKLLKALDESDPREWKLGFRRAQLLGLIEPAWAQPATTFPSTLQALAAALKHSMYKRQHDLMQRSIREVSAQQNLIKEVAPGPLALPEGARILGEAEVGRLRAGEALVLQPELLSDREMRVVDADLRRLVGSLASSSGSPCNVGALTGFLPLFDQQGNFLGGSGEGAAGDNAFSMAGATRKLLRLMAALPAEIERHGWPRRLSLPAFVQLGCYAARNGARCEHRSPIRVVCTRPFTDRRVFV